MQRLLFYYKHRHRRIVGTVVVFGFDYQIFSGVQFFQPAKKGIPLLKSGIAAAVNAQHQDSAFFQKAKGSLKGQNAGIRPGGQTVIPSRQIAEVKHNAAYTHGRSVVSHICMGIQDQLIVVSCIFFFQALPGVGKGQFLDVKGKYMAFFPAKTAKEQGVVSVSHGSVNAQVSFLYMLCDKVGAPLCDLIIHDKVLSAWIR